VFETRVVLGMRKGMICLKSKPPILFSFEVGIERFPKWYKEFYVDRK
jgi:hypothetical protein